MRAETPARRGLVFGVAGAVGAATAGMALGAAVLLGGEGVPGWLWAATGAVVPVAAGLGASPLGRRRSAVAASTAAVAGALGAAVVVGCAVAVLVSGRLPQAHEQDAVAPALLGALAGGVALLAVRPGAYRLTAVLGRARRGRPEQVVRAFAERSSRGAGQDDLLDLADSLRRTMGVRTAEIWRVEGTVLRRVASSPNRGPAAVETTTIQRDVLARADIAGPSWLELWLPELGADRTTGQVRAVAAAHFGELLGVVVVEKAPAEPFGTGEDSARVDLGHRLGAVLGTLELDQALRRTLADLQRANENLQASRARLVETADAERRRIERDLHDGAQQRLVALSISVSLIRAQLTSSPEAADDLLADLAVQLRATIDEVRELAHGIYPPSLARGGLADALRSVIARVPGPVDVTAKELGRYAPATEAAVYYCVLEALQNTGKHAPEAAVRIVLSEAEGRVRFTVADDGPGYDPAAVRHGHGLVNMSDRVGALGGEVTWSSAPGRGVSVAGWVPVRPEPIAGRAEAPGPAVVVDLGVPAVAEEAGR